MNDQPPKGFIGQLFCRHSWVRIRDLMVFESPGAKRAKLYTFRYRQWECEKCGKVVKKEI